MADYSTESLLLPHPGPWLGRVVNNLDPDLMGGLEVLLYEGSTGSPDEQGETVTVKYLPQFWGTTSIQFEGNNSASFNDVQKSYGMWFVPPDIGTTVMCFFIGGNRNDGYWVGVVPDRYQNHMVPGIAASKNVALTPEQERKYGTKYLPVAEFSKRNRDLSKPLVNDFTKPVHPFADRLLQQGLLLDDIRGVTSSSARREHPSGVFGISTPGPIDTSQNATKGQIGYKNSKVLAFVSRLGGHQLVMDDGDKNGLNELFRIRTRTGHQILLHNSSDLIYISNASGSAWIELTSQGKIDIYAADSVSIHSEGDFNLRAGRDFNIEARRSINFGAGNDFHADIAGSTVFNGSRDGTFQFGGAGNWKSANFALQSENDFDITVADALRLSASTGINLKSADVKIEASATASIKSKDLKMAASATAGLKGDTSLTLSSKGVLNLNGPPAPDALVADTPLPPDEADALPLYSLPGRALAEGWSDGKFFKTEDIVSIMKRVPTHEPWDQHENINPAQFNFENTDLEVDNRGKGLPGKNPSVTYNRSPATEGTPPVPTGNVEEDNIAAFLWTIRVCEGTSGPKGYQTMFTGATFDPESPTFKATNQYTQKYDGQPNKAYKWADHPRFVMTVIFTSNKTGKSRVLPSTATGAYQFLSTTWDQCKKALNLPDFSPASQDKAAIHLIKGAGALDNVKKGEFTKAVYKVKQIWASLPGSTHDQNEKSFQAALSYYKKGGGTFVA